MLKTIGVQPTLRNIEFFNVEEYALNSLNVINLIMTMKCASRLSILHYKSRPVIANVTLGIV